MMKTLRILIRILLGSVFIFSGFVKGVDPVGSSIKFEEYFQAFHLPWLESITLILAVLLSTAEFIIGISLAIGLKMKLTAWSALGFMVVFTLLTLYSALFSPVTDCGCFGDALKLSNWQTFYKNIFLLALAIWVFMERKNYGSYSNCWTEWSVISLFTVAITGISLHCIYHLPILDFRPYHVGTHIYSKMIIPDDAPKEISESVLLYQKDGVVKEFTIDNFPSSDTTWKFVDSKTIVKQEGYKPPIHDFSITSKEGEDITQKVLFDPGYSFLIISSDAEKLSKKEWKKIETVVNGSVASNASTYFLTGSSLEQVMHLKPAVLQNLSLYNTDVTALKTIIRSNPGLLLLHDGVILAKWHVNDFPDSTFFKGNLLSQVLTQKNKTLEHKRLFLLISALTLALSVIWFLKDKNN